MTETPVTFKQLLALADRLDAKSAEAVAKAEVADGHGGLMWAAHASAVQVVCNEIRMTVLTALRGGPMTEQATEEQPA